MRRLLFLLLTFSLVSFSTLKCHAETNVVVSIKPIHSLVAGVMEGVGSPKLIVTGAGSPHTYNLKPSEAKTLEQASLVFWVGEGLETFLEDPVKNIAGKARVVTLSEVEGLIKHPYREGGPWDEHGHDAKADAHQHGKGHHHDHDHEDKGHKHKGHEHKDHDKHGEKHPKNQGEGHEGHHHNETDMHIWLDPENAKIIVRAIAGALKEIDAANAAKYEDNSVKLIAKLDNLLLETKKETESLKGKPFIVFHDAYQYLEKRFDLNAAGSITISPENKPSAKRIAKIRKKIAEQNVKCLFSEPQFEPKILKILQKETKAQFGELDPLGASLADGPELYFELLRNNVSALKKCLL